LWTPKQLLALFIAFPHTHLYDWLALRDLQEKPETLASIRFGSRIVNKLSQSQLSKVDDSEISPLWKSLINEAIKDQKDPKAEQAHKELYKKSFTRSFKESCGPYSGKSVNAAQDILIADSRR